MSIPGSNAKLPAYVWEAPVRIWHWIMALAMSVLFVTGYLIGSPPPSVTGEASAHFLFGYIRFAHFAAALVFASVFVLRVYWAFVGNRYAREIFLVPVYMLRREWWVALGRVVRHYLFVGPGELHIGHNPVAMAAMFFMYVLGALFMMLTGFALYGEGLGRGSWAYTLFSSWVIPLFGQSQDVHTWHHLGMWYLIVFAIIHVYIVVREDIMSGTTIVSTMINGYRDAKR